MIDAELKSGALIDVFPEYQVTATEFNTAAWLVFPSRTYSGVQANQVQAKSANPYAERY